MSNHQESGNRPQKHYNGLQKKYVLYPPVNVLLLEGKDVVDFIHRMSTNDVRDLVEGMGKTTIFTNDRGRIIDVVDLYYLNGSIHLVHSTGAREELKRVFDKYVIMEDVTVHENPEYACILGLFGSTGTKEVFSGEAGSIEMSSPRIFPEGKLYYIGKKRVQELGLVKNGEPVDLKSFNYFRMERGIPLYDLDFSESFNPLESNLQEFISWTKGCYIGQEVIARLDTYQKIKRFLKGVVLDKPLSEDDTDRLESEGTNPAVLTIDNVEAGKITSYGFSDLLGTSILMVRFEKGKDKAGERVKIKIGEEKYPGKIVELPFI